MISESEMMNNPDRLDEKTTVVAAENCLSTVVDDETVILHQGDGVYYSVNEVGTLVWEQIQQPKSLDEVSEEIVSKYDVTHERCEQDVTEMLADMADENLVRFEE